MFILVISFTRTAIHNSWHSAVYYIHPCYYRFYTFGGASVTLDLIVLDSIHCSIVVGLLDTLPYARIIVKQVSSSTYFLFADHVSSSGMHFVFMLQHIAILRE